MLSTVIPSYNEANNIAITIKELVTEIEKAGYSDNYEIIVVDDHSEDGTIDVIKNFKNEKIKCLRLSRRSGSHTAIRAGLVFAKGDVVLCISADGQDDPKVLNEMLLKWKNGSQIIWGIRKKRNEPFGQRSFAVLFYKLLKTVTKIENKIDLSHADFYLLDRKVVGSLNTLKEKNTSLFGLIAWIGFKQDFVEYERRERKSGKSKWNFKSRLNLARDWIIAFSGIPLKFITWTGVFMAAVGFLYALVILLLTFKGFRPQGWTSLMIVLLVMGGAQMIMSGIIGEYLWRNLEESRKRPFYFIENKTNNFDK